MRETKKRMKKLNKLIRTRKEKIKERKKSQYKGICMMITTMKPRKPNSGIKKIIKVKIKIRKKIRIVKAYVPGEKHNIVQHAVVLIRPTIRKDLPNVNYEVIRNKYDVTAVIRKTSRSKYGCSKNK